MDALALDYRTIEDASRIKGVNYYNLRSWIIRNAIPTRKIGRRVIVVRLSDLEAYVPRDRQLASAR